MVASASAALAPQIATAPAASVPKPGLKPSLRAANIPPPMTSATIATMLTSAAGPRSAICPTVIRTPTSTIPHRSSDRAANAVPGARRVSADRKFNDSPMSSAISVSGAW